MNIPPEIEAIFQMARDRAARMRSDYRTGVRRVVGTAEWKSDPERIAAAADKRARRLARNRRNA
jgi:hypothetical protein